MNNFTALDWRNKRNLLAHGMNAFSPPFHKNFSTDTTADMKSFENMYINSVHLIPEPMKTNLADSVVSLDENKLKTNMATETKGFVNSGCDTQKHQGRRSDFYPSLAGIASFFSGVLNVMGGMFQKRANSPVQYYDCFEQGYEDRHQVTPSLAWQAARLEDQNKNGRAEADAFADGTYSEFLSSTDMSEGFGSIAAQCEDKLNRVRILLAGGGVRRPAPRARRPKRAFHEAGSVDELFEDAFAPEDFISLANETFLEYCSPYNHHHDEYNETDSPHIKVETGSPKSNNDPVEESMEIVQTLPPKECGESKTNTPEPCLIEDNDTKRQVVSACEDKVSQLKALLQGRRQQKSRLDTNLTLSTNIIINTEKTTEDTMEENSSETAVSKEIEIPITPDSPHVLDPNNYFDEVTGRFYSSSATDSEDSFQIVFSDSPRNGRKRIPSDCESEDSFIVFEESPDSCYTSNDVFGDDTNDVSNLNSDSEDSDSDGESDIDSGVSTVTLSNSLSRTFGDLTDGSLYEDSVGEDVVDCAFRSGTEVPKELIDPEKVKAITSQDQSGDSKGGLLLNEAKKQARKKLPAKKVHFSPMPPRVHVMRVWAFAARQARAGHWERHALDRERFKRRIADVDMAVSWVLKPQHRSRVMFQRFMPWWNAQKRKELAEKRQKEEEERSQREKEAAVEEARLQSNKELVRDDDDGGNKIDVSVLGTDNVEKATNLIVCVNNKIARENTENELEHISNEMSKLRIRDNGTDSPVSNIVITADECHVNGEGMGTVCNGVVDKKFKDSVDTDNGGDNINRTQIKNFNDKQLMLYGHGKVGNHFGVKNGVNKAGIKLCVQKEDRL